MGEVLATKSPLHTFLHTLWKYRERLRVIKNYSYSGTLWELFQIILALLSCLAYVTETYTHTSYQATHFFAIFEFLLTQFFLLDFIWCLLITPSCFIFLQKPMTWIDLFTIFPIYLSFFHSSLTLPIQFSFLRFVRILRLGRILRIFQFLKDFNGIQRQIFSIILTTLCLIFLAVTILYLVENDYKQVEYRCRYINQWTNYQPSCSEFEPSSPHSLPSPSSASSTCDCETYECRAVYAAGDHKDQPSGIACHSLTFLDTFYFIVVTLAGVGYGDISPTLTLSRVVIILFILTSLLVLPSQINQLTILISMTSPYRKPYRVNPGFGHVIVCGHLSNQLKLTSILREFFHPDQLNTWCYQLVLLSPHEPTEDIKLLLTHSYLESQLFYYTGTALSLYDLEAVRADCASAIFFFCNTEVDEVSAHHDDRANEIRSLCVGNYFPSLPVYMQILQSHNREALKHVDHEMTLCYDEYKMTLQARNCLCPGLSTLVENLFHTFGTKQHIRLGYQSHDLWSAEYCAGACMELYAIPLPTKLMEMLTYSWVLLIEVVGLMFDCVVIGVHNSTRRDSCDVILHPGPGSMANYPSVAAFYQIYDHLILMCSDANKATRISQFFSENSAIEKALLVMMREEEKFSVTRKINQTTFKSQQQPTSPSSTTSSLMSFQTLLMNVSSISSTGSTQLEYKEIQKFCRSQMEIDEIYVGHRKKFQESGRGGGGKSPFPRRNHHIGDTTWKNVLPVGAALEAVSEHQVLGEVKTGDGETTEPTNEVTPLPPPRLEKKKPSERIVFDEEEFLDDRSDHPPPRGELHTSALSHKRTKSSKRPGGHRQYVSHRACSLDLDHTLETVGGSLVPHGITRRSLAEFRHSIHQLPTDHLASPTTTPIPTLPTTALSPRRHHHSRYDSLTEDDDPIDQPDIRQLDQMSDEECNRIRKILSRQIYSSPSSSAPGSRHSTNPSQHVIDLQAALFTNFERKEIQTQPLSAQVFTFERTSSLTNVGEIAGELISNSRRLSIGGGGACVPISLTRRSIDDLHLARSQSHQDQLPEHKNGSASLEIKNTSFLSNHLIIFGSVANIHLFIAELRRVPITSAQYYPVLIVHPSAPEMWNKIKTRFHDVYYLSGQIDQPSDLIHCNINTASRMILLVDRLRELFDEPANLDSKSLFTFLRIERYIPSHLFFSIELTCSRNVNLLNSALLRSFQAKKEEQRDRDKDKDKDKEDNEQSTPLSFSQRNPEVFFSPTSNSSARARLRNGNNPTTPSERLKNSRRNSSLSYEIVLMELQSQHYEDQRRRQIKESSGKLFGQHIPVSVPPSPSCHDTSSSSSQWGEESLWSYLPSASLSTKTVVTETVDEKILNFNRPKRVNINSGSYLPTYLELWNIEGTHHALPAFASSKVFAPTGLDSLLCQVSSVVVVQMNLTPLPSPLSFLPRASSVPLPLKCASNSSADRMGNLFSISLSLLASLGGDIAISFALLSLAVYASTLPPPLSLSLMIACSGHPSRSLSCTNI
jgi:hypothetical protein